MINYAKRCDIGSPIGEIWIPQNEPCDMWSNWEFPVREFILKRITNKTHFMDIGANLGYFSLWVSTKAEKVFSVEPNPILYEILKDNLLRFPNAQAYNIALGDKALGDKALGDKALEDKALKDKALKDKALKDKALKDKALKDKAYGYEGHRTFYYRIDAAGDGRAYNPNDYGDGNKWLMIYAQNETLCSFQDKYFPGVGINFIKIDCEGSEYEILMGEHSESFFNREENKSCEVLLELHGPMIESRKLDFSKFIDYLLSNFIVEDSYGSRFNNAKDIPVRGHVLLKS